MFRFLKSNWLMVLLVLILGAMFKSKIVEMLFKVSPKLADTINNSSNSSTSETP